MEDVLSVIIERKREELEGKDYRTIEKEALAIERATISMSKSLRESKNGIIAEFKRKSPSKGWINSSADPATTIKGYEQSGAAAVSVLTDKDFFGGDSQFLIDARSEVNLPLLRKEFIVDKYQVYEARIIGADAILLIAACLSKEECRELACTAHLLKMEVLLEVHSEDELDRLNEFVDMLGVNNRNLGTFHTDVDNSFRMAEKMRESSPNLVLVSESGICDSSTIQKLRAVGFRGFLIGENFMRDNSPADKLNEFVEQLS
ncbi:MAG: indole-3-glycerol phosphate synthase TrpC [Rikenellaceae bacterium]